MASTLLGLLGGLPQSNARNDDDIADRLNHRYTVSVLIIMSVVITSKLYVGDPIKCWHEAHFSGPWKAYTNTYCWVKDTYYLPFEDEIPKAHESDKRERITYYQWVGLILLAQAFLFYLPIMLWRALNERSGIDINNVIETAESFNETAKVEKKESHLKFMTSHMNRYLSSRNTIAKKDCVVGCTHLLTRMCFCCSRAGGTYLIPLYLFTKVLFLFNCIGQLFLLNALLGTDYHLYGFKWLSTQFSGNEFEASEAFPRVTMCDVHVRRLGNVHRYSMQCVLPINLFNEMVFLIIWFWFVGVATITAGSLVSWAVRSTSRRDRHRYVRKHLGLIKHMSRATGYDRKRDPYEDDDTAPGTPESDDSIAREKAAAKEGGPKYVPPDPYNWDRNTFIKFVDEHLKADGVFILRLIQHNTNSLTVDEFLAEIWDYYQKDESEKKPIYQPI